MQEVDKNSKSIKDEPSKSDVQKSTTPEPVQETTKVADATKPNAIPAIVEIDDTSKKVTIAERVTERKYSSSEDDNDDDDEEEEDGRVTTRAGKEIDRKSAGNVKRTKEECEMDTEQENEFGYTACKE